ncbi:dTDP-glucose 4,6-dehydratase [Alicyclobacillus ferrooxydans]|uniref:dTDP-glucose 4,6-dehydratase n=1 Tax=Alicyclobacillus ferrooxydans TaxID=471514 RepID=A0A0N8PNU2_9BACL|nr:dTDP-glucose 4,6-dehydratase [Alicyclobacillus ferrooxydans]KPV42477.1 spore coat protein [Alicyclobacillus ferrooxydans]
MRILVTGGAGFIGGNFIRYMCKTHPQDMILNFDTLTYAGNLESLANVEDVPNYHFIRGDITSKHDVEQIFRQGIDIVVNFAAESHVDRSILDPAAFVRTNVLGTQILLEKARMCDIQKFVQVSTDEVYGTLGTTGYFTEESPLLPNSPYSASKAGADCLVRAYHETYGLPVNITRCSNNYGPYQFPEKLIPLMIINALHDQPLPVYGDGLNIRDWLHVEDHCRAIDLVLHEGRDGEVYNVGGDNERANIEIVKSILKQLDKPESLIQFVEDRLGHDRRYAIDASKIRKELGWEPRYTFEEGLRETVQWYVNHPDWWENVLSGEYRKYYDQQYGDRLGSLT